MFIHIFPLHRKLYLLLFVLVNIWTIFIHDSDMITGHALEKVINGPAHHTLHHMYFTVNYGQVSIAAVSGVLLVWTVTDVSCLQYFTWADRWGGSYRQPAAELDPLLEVKAAEAKRAKKDL